MVSACLPYFPRSVHESKSESVKLLNRVQLFVTPWTIVHQAPLPMEFSRQEYWSGLSSPSSGDLPNPGIKPASPVLQTDSSPSELLYRNIKQTCRYMYVNTCRKVWKHIHTHFFDCYSSGSRLRKIEIDDLPEASVRNPACDKVMRKEADIRKACSDFRDPSGNS